MGNLIAEWLWSSMETGVLETLTLEVDSIPLHAAGETEMGWAGLAFHKLDAAFSGQQGNELSRS